MNTRRWILLTLLVAGAAILLEAQTRRTGPTREDQHPAPSTSSPARGEQRAPDPPAPPEHHDPPPPPQHSAPPPQPRPPIGGVPIEGDGPVLVLQPVVTTVPDLVPTTPIWPVVGTELSDRLTDAENAGYNFEDGEAVAFDDDDVDAYFESEGPLLRVADDSDIEDLGPAKSVREHLRISRDGWEVRKEVNVEPGHQYAVWRWNGDVVRIYVQNVLDNAVVFDWMPDRAIARPTTNNPIFGR